MNFPQPAYPQTLGLICPRCGATMEEIENGFDELPLEQMRLCPSCYLVAWRDDAGEQFGQGTALGNSRAIVS